MAVRMSRSRTCVEWRALRLICLSVIKAKKRSIWLIQEAQVGVKSTCQCGRLAGQSRTALASWVA
jgi:hypothetical protein